MGVIYREGNSIFRCNNYNQDLNRCFYNNKGHPIYQKCHIRGIIKGLSEDNRRKEIKNCTLKDVIKRLKEEQKNI